MRIAIIGTGGVGGFFGIRLADAGNDVSFLARRKHLSAMREKGLSLLGPKGEIHLTDVAASDKVADLGPVDVALFCVKLYDTEDVGRELAPALSENGYVISLQNGVEAAERLGPILGRDRVCVGNAFMSARIAEPGVVRYTSDMSTMEIGEAGGGASPRLDAFAERCNKAGFTAHVADDIEAKLWSKFVLLSTNAAFTTAFRQPCGPLYRNQEIRDLARDAMAEVVAVGQAKGVNVDNGAIERAMGLLDTFPDDMYASMYHDLARGGRLEVGSLSGTVYRLGKEFGVPTPIHRTLYLSLLPYENGPA